MSILRFKYFLPLLYVYVFVIGVSFGPIFSDMHTGDYGNSLALEIGMAIVAIANFPVLIISQLPDLIDKLKVIVFPNWLPTKVSMIMLWMCVSSSFYFLIGSILDKIVFPAKNNLMKIQKNQHSKLRR